MIDKAISINLNELQAIYFEETLKDTKTHTVTVKYLDDQVNII